MASRRSVVLLIILAILFLPGVFMPPSADAQHRHRVPTVIPTIPPTATSPPTIVPMDTPAPSPVPSATSTGAPALYWGALNSGSPYDLTIQDRFETEVGKHAAIIHWGYAWMNNGIWEPFPVTYLEAIRRRGSIPMLDWASWDFTKGPTQPDFTDASIAAGVYDSFLHQEARAAAAWGHPFFLRFDHEMNGYWQFAWSAQLNTNTPAGYVAMWRHIHDIFVQEGATNATWVWCPNVADNQTTPIDSVYPGDAFVDWTCLDGYNWNSPWESFDQVYAGTSWNPHNSYQEVLAVAPNKPMMIGEFASAEAGDDGTAKAAWIRDTFARIPQAYPAIRAVVWYNLNDGVPWPVDSTPKALDAFRRAIADPIWRGVFP